MTDWRGNGDKVSAVLHADHEPVPELDYARLTLLDMLGYSQANPNALDEVREQQRDEVRQARGDAVRL